MWDIVCLLLLLPLSCRFPFSPERRVDVEHARAMTTAGNLTSVPLPAPIHPLTASTEPSGLALLQVRSTHIQLCFHWWQWPGQSKAWEAFKAHPAQIFRLYLGLFGTAGSQCFTFAMESIGHQQPARSEVTRGFGGYYSNIPQSETPSKVRLSESAGKTRSGFWRDLRYRINKTHMEKNKKQPTNKPKEKKAAQSRHYHKSLWIHWKLFSALFRSDCSCCECFLFFFLGFLK